LGSFFAGDLRFWGQERGFLGSFRKMDFVFSGLQTTPVGRYGRAAAGRRKDDGHAVNQQARGRFLQRYGSLSSSRRWGPP
jgi:hypothetical protein